jgi:hypothetical protein
MLLKDMQPCCSPAFNHATAPTAQQVRSQEEARLMKSVVSRVHLILDGCQDLTETPQAHASLGVGLRVGVGVGFGGTEESMVLGGGFVSEKQTLEKRVDGLVALLRAQRGQIDALNAKLTSGVGSGGEKRKEGEGEGEVEGREVRLMVHDVESAGDEDAAAREGLCVYDPVCT